MIKLYQFQPAFGLPNASPFCMKVENYLRMARLQYEIAPRASHFRAPKGKLPYIEDGAKIIADSSFIIEYLKSAYGDPLDVRLTPLENAQALALRRMMEENLYWALAYTRWMEPQGWKVTKAEFFKPVPALLRGPISAFAHRGVARQLWGHGLGRHSTNEVHRIGNTDITALADFLGEKPFFMGESPTSLDASAYAFLANIILVPLDSALKRHALKYPQLEAYCLRMRARYYP
ncbi:MAG TPA: glutathione S-transferase family protein [Burkholderiales bacterium]|nr:glutathione S-transferase family protein [Burkholderiales bacterium]